MISIYYQCIFLPSPRVCDYLNRVGWAGRYYHFIERTRSSLWGPRSHCLLLTLQQRLILSSQSLEWAQRIPTSNEQSIKIPNPPGFEPGSRRMLAERATVRPRWLLSFYNKWVKKVRPFLKWIMIFVKIPRCVNLKVYLENGESFRPFHNFLGWGIFLQGGSVLLNLSLPIYNREKQVEM